jgi:hypothetical protein
MIPNIVVLLEELHEMYSSPNKDAITLTKEDIHILLHYIRYLQQVESHVKNSLQNDILSPFGFARD